MVINDTRFFFENPNRRMQTDRRANPTNPFRLTAYRGRRKEIRRKEDRRRYPYADQHGHRLFLVTLMLILLCVADACYTLMHVSRGAMELNPLMDILLQQGPYFFFWVKYALSAYCIILLVLYKHHPLARATIGGAVIVYGTLFCYHLFLFFTWPHELFILTRMP